MNKKGFTLVEVLLVVVIIGIIGVITIPNIIDSLQASREKSGKTVENILLNSLELYNEDHKIDLWDYTSDTATDINKCKSITLATLKTFNPDINMGECKAMGDTPFIIKRTAKDKFEYYVSITCSKDFNDSYSTYYKSKNAYICNWN